MTQINIEKEKESTKNAKNIVMEYLQAAERQDFQTVRGYLSDNLSYVGPLNSFEGIEPYLKYFEHLKLPKFDYKRVFEDGNDVCLLYVRFLNFNFVVCIKIILSHLYFNQRVRPGPPVLRTYPKSSLFSYKQCVYLIAALGTTLVSSCRLPTTIF